MSNDIDIDKAYVSSYDRFLYEFDATHQKSASQLKEIKKHQRLAEIRDNKDHKEQSSAIWEDF
jgi:hypothetical protein